MRRWRWIWPADGWPMVGDMNGYIGGEVFQRYMNLEFSTPNFWGRWAHFDLHP